MSDTKLVPRNSSNLSRLLHSNDLVDAWREDNPSTRDYTFYSHVHGTYSWIDHIFIGSTLQPYVTSVRILSTPWAVLSPVRLSLSDLWKKPHPSLWRLNAILLNDPGVLTDIEVEIRYFFRENLSSATSSIINWAAHKATIHGKLLQITSRIKQSRDSTITQLETELIDLLLKQRASPLKNFTPNCTATQRKWDKLKRKIFSSNISMPNLAQEHSEQMVREF